MHNFTPMASLLGGILIGVSASAMLLLDGRIAGISGIPGGALTPTRGNTGLQPVLAVLATATVEDFVSGRLR
jgi:uncharacterized protein